MSNVLAFWDKAQYIITNGISINIQTSIQQYGSKIELMFIVILIYIIWSIFNYILKEYILKIKTIAENDQWETVILKLAEFITTVLFFLVTGIIFSNIFSVISLSNLDAFESFVFIMSVLLVFFSTMYRLHNLLSITLIK